MFTSGFGKTPKHRKFDYTPRFWDPEKEALEKTVNQYKGNLSDEEKVKLRISAGLRNRYVGDEQYRQKHVRKSNKRILYITAILVIITYLIIRSERILRMVEAFTQ
jgi:hypothetical protein